MRKLLSIVLAAILMLTAIPIAHAATKFSDVPRQHWAYEAINEMADKGIIKGYSDGTFRPNNRITRAEFAKIMIAAAGIKLPDDADDVKQTFKDVDRDDWEFLYVELAKNYLTGYKVGSSYYYKPDEAAVREDIAVALVRLMGYDRTKKANLSTLNKFRDDYRISKALRPYIAIAVDTNLIKGFNDGTFRPLSPITRAEAALLLYRAQLDETKVVFPVEPKPDQPNNISITDTFSDNELENWDVNIATGKWVVAHKQATAYSANTELHHYFLPLKWKEDTKPKNYEIQVDVNPDGTDGLGGLFFNGQDGKKTVVYFAKDAIYVSKVEDVNKKDMQSVAKVAYKLQKTNKLKIVVKGDDYSIYANNSFVYGQLNQDLKGTKLGLYLSKEAAKDIPEDITYFDNFSFKVLD